MRLRFIASFLLTASACSEPPCADGERKVGSTCHRLSQLDGGQAPEGVPDDDGTQPVAKPDPRDGGDAAPADAVSESSVPQTSVVEGSVRIDAAWNATCAFHATGDAWCWGDSFPTSGTHRLKPELTPVLMHADRLWQRSTTACARFHGNQLKCWGKNTYGDVGDGTLNPRVDPFLVPDLGDILVASIGGANVCALLNAGGVKCWGADGILGNNGQLGNDYRFGPPRKMQPNPRIVAGTDDAVCFSGGSEHNCACRPDGTVECWGANFYGQLGDGTRTTRAELKKVLYVYDATTVRVGGSQTCVTTKDRRVMCWDYTYDESAPVANPFHMPQLADVVSLAMGGNHGCALHSSGVVSCWGDNTSGELGDGTIVSRKTPAQVPGLNGVVQLVVGSSHSCARLESSEVRCWGDNQYGQLGDGTTISRLSPVPVVGLP